MAHSLVCVWALFFAYAAVGMPAVLNPRSDKHLAEEAERLAAGSDIYYVNPWEHLRPYCANFYLRDRLQLLPTLADAESLPAGTVVLVPQQADTTGCSGSFTFREVTESSCDSRKSVAAAIRNAK